jgi:cell division protease FtsH
MDEFDEVSKISIVPRGNAGGVTIFTPQEDSNACLSKQYLLNKICVGMGGRIAEELVNGHSKITSGAQGDF